MGGIGGTCGREKKCTQVLVKRHEGKKPFERRRRRWEDVDWINLAQDREK